MEGPREEDFSWKLLPRDVRHRTQPEAPSPWEFQVPGEPRESLLSRGWDRPWPEGK